MSVRKILLEEKKKKGKKKGNGKMLQKLHALDDQIENFIQQLETKIDAVKDNPVFQQKAHNLLADMSREYSEFIIALRAVVNAVDRKSQIVPKWERQPSKIRDIHKDSGNEGPPPPQEGQEEEPPANESLREALDEAVDKKLFTLGRKVQDELHNVHGGMTLKPKDADFKKAAKALGITKSKAIKAWNEFTWGN